MKKHISKVSFYLFLGAFLTFSFGAISANPASVNGTATARILTPLTVSNTTQLNFGHIVPHTTSGDITITTGNTFTANGGVVLLSSPAPVPAEIRVTGEASYVYTVQAISDATLTRSGGSETMTLTNLSAYAVSGTLGTLSAGGIQDIRLNGKLNIAANQVAGTYTGPYTVTVQY